MSLNRTQVKILSPLSVFSFILTTLEGIKKVKYVRITVYPWNVWAKRLVILFQHLWHSRTTVHDKNAFQQDAYRPLQWPSDGGGCLPGGCVHSTLWTEFLTHACENITFPQLCLRTVKIIKIFCRFQFNMDLWKYL